MSLPFQPGDKVQKKPVAFTTRLKPGVNEKSLQEPPKFVDLALNHEQGLADTNEPEPRKELVGVNQL